MTKNGTVPVRVRGSIASCILRQRARCGIHAEQGNIPVALHDCLFCQIANNVFGEVYTSLDLTEIVELLADIANYNITDTAGFPQEEQTIQQLISCGGNRRVSAFQIICNT